MVALFLYLSVGFYLYEMIDKRIFTGGINTDIDSRLLPQGDYRYALNLRVTSSKGDNVGTAEVVNGNTLVLGATVPTGRNKCIGAHRSEERDSIFYFVWNSGGDHSIYEYSLVGETVVRVIGGSALNFQEFSLITGIDDVNGLLFWTDDFNQPRRINIDKFIAHTASNGANIQGYGTGFITGSDLDKERYINAIKAQPYNAPTLDFFTEPSRSVNNIRGRFLRFRYRYVYDDSDKSAWSEPSIVGFTPYDFIIDSSSLTGDLGAVYSFLDVQRLFNGVRLTMFSSHETVVGFEVSVAEGYNDFFLWREFTKEDLSLDDDVPFSVEYFGDSVLTALDINDSLSPFDDVPLRAKALSLIEGNRIAYGNILKGYDSVDLNVALSPTYKSITDLPSFGIEFGSVIDFRSLGSTFLDGGQVNGYSQVPANRDFVYHRRRWNIGAQQFKDLLIASGVEVIENSLVEIDYNLGLFPVPYSQTGVDLDSISVLIPFMEFTDFDDPYFYLYNLLNTTRLTPLIGEYEGVTGQGAGNNALALDFSVPYTVVVDGTTYSGVLYLKRRQMFAALISSGQEDFTSPFGGNRFSFFEFYNFADTMFAENPPFSSSTWSNGLWDFEQELNALVFSRGVVTFRARCIPFDNINNTTFKSGATHRFGLVYFDAYGRSGFANANSQCEVYVSSLPERNIETGTEEDFIANIEWRINHAPPSWATHYAWVYAGNNRTDDFLWLPVGSPTSQGFISPNGSSVRFSLRRLLQLQNENKRTQLSYDYTTGDRLTFLTKPPVAGALTNNWRQSFEVIDLPVVDGEVDGEDYVITVPKFLSDLDLTTAPEYVNSLVELYKRKPLTSDDALIYYTLSPKYAIENGVHTVPTGVFTRGDVYVKRRVYYLNPSAVGGTGTSDVSVSFYIESPLINDFVDSAIYDRGKAFTVDRSQGQGRYIDQVTWSESLLVGSRINGLSKFNPIVLPFREYGRVYGAIQHLHADDNRLEVYHEDKVQYSLVSRDVIYNNQGGASVVGTLDNVLSDPVAFLGEYGISNNPESFAFFGGARYFVDRKRGVVCRLANDGITPVSDGTTLSYFRDTLQRSFSTYQNGAVYGGYDPRYSEYVISIEDRFRVEGQISALNLTVAPTVFTVFFADGNIPEFFEMQETVFYYVGADGVTYSFVVDLREGINVLPAEGGVNIRFVPLGDHVGRPFVGGTGWFLNVRSETIGFNENTNRWTSFYSFAPEFMSRAFNDLVSFKGGLPYIHGKGNQCEFYGVVTPSELWVISNAQPSLKKFFKALSVESDVLFVPYEITTPSGQLSSLIAEDFEEKEGFYYSQIYRDALTPSQTVEGEVLDNALFEGDMMRDYSLLLKMRVLLGSGSELFAVNVVFEVSNLAAQEG